MPRKGNGVRAALAKAPPGAKRRFDQAFKREVAAAWAPDPGNRPQVAAYESEADILLYGGAAGGGKTDLLIGLALTRHQRSVIFRCTYVALPGSRPG